MDGIEKLQDTVDTTTAAAPSEVDASRSQARSEVIRYLDLVRELLILEPKMAAALISKAHRKALDYARLTGDEE